MFLKNPHLDLTTSHIETDRCVLVPFSTDGRVDIRELQEQFCIANRNLWISPMMPTYDQEYAYVQQIEQAIARQELFENFILDKTTRKLIGCIGFNRPEEHRMNLGLWIRQDMQGQGYGREVYTAMLAWARQHLVYQYVKHSCNEENIKSRQLALAFGGIPQEAYTENGNIIYHIPLY